MYSVITTETIKQGGGGIKGTKQTGIKNTPGMLY